MAKTAELHDLAARPDSIKQLDMAQLKALWGRCCPQVPAAAHRNLLLQDIATLAQGGGSRLPRETDVLVRAAMRAASVTRSAEEKAGGRKKALPVPKASKDIPPGTVLVREWGGQKHEVKVLGGGWFVYQGQTYRSLTKVARIITGAHWSGPCFFGLNKFRRKS